MTARLPLRIVDPKILSKTWSEGHTYYDYERRAPRGLEKDIAEMTLEELIATQSLEPLSESRRSYLTRGEGVHSLDAPASYDSPLELMEYVADDTTRCIVDLIDEGYELEDAIDEASLNDRAYRGTAYEHVDPTTARQILWEQERAQDGPLYKLQLQATAAGRLTIANVGRGIQAGHDFTKIATSAIKSVFASVGKVETLDELHARVDTLSDVLSDPVAHLYHEAVDTEERERYFLPDDEIVHSSYESIEDDGENEPYTLIHHRSKSRSPWELWHHELPRNSSDPHELGFDLITNDELESLLGVSAWNTNGTPLSAS